MRGFTIIAIVLIVGLINCDLPPQTPVIGIYTMDAEDFIQQGHQNDGKLLTYIASSYIKNIQMAGGQVVPLFYHYTEAQLDDILGKLNGVFFPGGQMPIDMKNQWTSKLAYIMQYADRKNIQGTPYPVWATCLGYQAVMYVTSGNSDNTTVLTQVFGQDGKTCALDVKNTNSQLLKSLNSAQYKEATSDDGIFFFHHTWSVLASTFNNNNAWRSSWNVISTSFTSDGVQFLSTLESKQYPYFLTQYHPQKNSYEWRIPAKRSYNAVSASQKFINTFMSYARRNPHQFPAQQLKKKIIYNYHPVLTPLDYSFVQVYIFDETNI